MAKIVRTDQELECPIIDKTLVERGHDLVLLPDGIDEDALIDAVREVEILLMCYTPITKNVIDAADNLKAIVKYGVGIDAIDIEAAKARNIPVVNIPEYAERTVAEGAFTLMIALAKKLIPLDRAMHANDWVWPETSWRGIDIAGKTVGLIGAGKIAQSMAQMAGAGFGAQVIGYSPHAARTDARNRHFTLFGYHANDGGVRLCLCPLCSKRRNETPRWTRADRCDEAERISDQHSTWCHRR